MKREELDIPVPDLRCQRGLEYTCPSASWGDMTGLIPYAAEDDAQLSNYDELYPYLPEYKAEGNATEQK